MRALIVEAANRLALTDIPEPPLPAGECRVAVKLAGICRTDLELLKGYMGFRGVPGHEFVGVVTEGPDHLLGRRVVGEINVPCDLARYGQPGYDPRHDPDRTVLGILKRPGAFAETLTLPAQNLFPVPDSVSDEEAVFTEPLAAALEIFEQIHVPPGERVLVIGDGKLGLLIAQVFAVFGHRVTLQGRHEKKLALAKRWGVQTVSVPRGPSLDTCLEQAREVQKNPAVILELGAFTPEDLERIVDIMEAMSPAERASPETLEVQECKRIATTSGQNLAAVQKFLREYRQVSEQLERLNQSILKVHAQKFPLIVEATGSPAGFKAALEQIAPRGTIVLKSTYAPDALPPFDAAKAVVDEIRLIGSRCGRFAPALRLLAQGKADVRSLIDHRKPFAQGAEAFELAGKKGVLKVLIQVA